MSPAPQVICAVRTPEWKLRGVDPSTGHREHLLAVEHTDIGEGVTLVRMGPEPEPGAEADGADLAAQRPEIVAELAALHERWREKTEPAPSVS